MSLKSDQLEVGGSVCVNICEIFVQKLISKGTNAMLSFFSVYVYITASE